MSNELQQPGLTFETTEQKDSETTAEVAMRGRNIKQVNSNI